MFVVFALVVVTYFQANLLVTTLSAYLLQQYSFGAQFLLAVSKLSGYIIILAVFDV
jgi:hypothetical protein